MWYRSKERMPPLPAQPAFPNQKLPLTSGRWLGMRKTLGTIIATSATRCPTLEVMAVLPNMMWAFPDQGVPTARTGAAIRSR